MTKLPILERLYRHVEKDENDCWNWTAATFRDSGYGVIRVDRQTRLAHRISFQAHGLGDPTGYFVCHRCDNRLCINPDHLFLGTPKDNVDDMVSKNRQCRKQPRVDAALGAKRVALRKLNEDQVKEILERSAAGATGKHLAMAFNVDPGTISCILRGKTWSHISGIPCPRHTWNKTVNPIPLI